MRETLPIRKRLRIKYYDYSKENMYFVTICIKDRLELLGKIKDMILIIDSKKENNLSRIIKQYKSCVSKPIGYSIWQKSFYEHIIRNEEEYIKTKKYI